jgi:hypothetical protein
MPGTGEGEERQESFTCGNGGVEDSDAWVAAALKLVQTAWVAAVLKLVRISARQGCMRRPPPGPQPALSTRRGAPSRCVCKWITLLEFTTIQQDMHVVPPKCTPLLKLD